MSQTETPERRSRQFRLSNEQKEQVRKLYLIDGLTEQQIADRVPGITRKTVNNFVYRNRLSVKKQQLERRKEVVAERAVENLLQRTEKRLANATDRAIAVFEDSLADAELKPGGKRLNPLQEARLALAIVNDVSGRDQAKAQASAAPVLHLHAHTWAPRRVDLVAETPVTGIPPSDTPVDVPSEPAE